MDVFLDPDRRLAIAHRGGARRRPENTMAACDYAVGLGVDAIELDLQLSRDGEAVVIHDPTVDRTTSGTGLVRDFTADALCRLDAGYRFDDPERLGTFPYRGQDIGVPTLAAVLARHRDMRFTLELKGRATALADRALEVVRRAGAVDRVSFGSFHWRALAHVRRAGRGLVTSASVAETFVAWAGASAGLAPRWGAYALFQLPEYRGGWHIVTERFVDAARAAGRPTQVWVVNAPADMARLLAWGVTGLISDVPDIAMDAIYSRPEGAHAEGERVDGDGGRTRGGVGGGDAGTGGPGRGGAVGG